jgi:glutaredoxin
MLKFLTFVLMLFCSVQLMADQGPANASLFYSPTCGHCQKVLAYLRQEHKTLPLKNVNDSANYSEYKSLGTSGVPVLVANGQTIMGAEGIISYMRQHPEILR